MVIWLSGLSGSGKTTIGRLLWKKLQERLGHAVILDGDEVRAALGGDFGHDLESRRLNSIRIGRLCELLNRQNIPVVCCAMTIAPEVQLSNRMSLSDYLEVYLDVSLEVLERRDPKSIYSRAKAGFLRNVAGIDIPYTPPTEPHLVIDNNFARDDCTEIVNLILAAARL